MKPPQVRVLIDKFEALLKNIERMQSAVELSKDPDVEMHLRIYQAGKQGHEQFPIKFNLEIGQALYQAKLDEHLDELEEIKRRIDLWK